MPESKTRTLITDENLVHLRRMPAESVDLIIVDPPVIRDEQGRVTPPALKKSSKTNFNWSWKQDIGKETEFRIQNDFPAVMTYLHAADKTYGREMGAFLGFQAVRLIELRRIMKQDSTIFLECGSRGSHYSKQLMDAIFGYQNFQYETLWKRHEIIAKEFNQAKLSSYNSILRYTKNQAYSLKRNLSINLPNFVWNNLTRQVRYDSIFAYPTQKPVILYEKMIENTTKPGDLILDPFAGTCSSLIAAEKLGRQWIGIDIWTGARNLLNDRLEQELGGPIPEIMYPEKSCKEIEPEKPRNFNQLIKLELLKAHKDRCQGCGYSFPHPEHLELDHILPKSEGGSDELQNRILLCHPCNQLKRNRLTVSGLREMRKMMVVWSRNSKKNS